MITVACVWVRGHVPFSEEYVVRLRSMAKRHAPEHRFVCLTDQADKLRSYAIECVRIHPFPGIYAWWNKLRLFDPSVGLFGRVLYLDLDVLIKGDLEEVVWYEGPIALAPDGAPFFKPKTHQVVKRFNSSVMAFDAGQNNDLFLDWKPVAASRLWGDQDWIGERRQHVKPMPRSWFPRLSEVRPPWPKEAKVILCKKPKNADALKQWTWFDKEWR